MRSLHLIYTLIDMHKEIGRLPEEENAQQS